MNTTAGTRKTALTPEEKVRCAFGHICLGIDQHHLAALYGVNSGRIAEAIDSVRKAVGWEANGASKEKQQIIGLDSKI